MKIRTGQQTQARHTAPPHRSAQGRITDGDFEMPVELVRGRVTVRTGSGLEKAPDGSLQVKGSDGLVLDRGTLKIDPGDGLEITGGKVAVKPAEAIQTLVQSISSPPTQGEVEAVRDYLIDVVQLLRDAKLVREDV